MAIYTSLDDLRKRLDPEVLAGLADDVNTPPDLDDPDTQDVIEQAIADGAQLIDSYVLGRAELGNAAVQASLERINATLAAAGIELEPDLLAAFDGAETLPYDVAAIARFRQVINWVDSAFKTFKGGLREETSPVQVFPHHMDVSMNWFSGRLIPGVDPADEESADEQMNFGFVTGDGPIPDAYFYVTAYPSPDGWTDLALPGGAYWHTEGWTGAVLPYAAVVATARPLELLLEYLRRLQAHGAKLMA